MLRRLGVSLSNPSHACRRVCYTLPRKPLCARRGRTMGRKLVAVLVVLLSVPEIFSQCLITTVTGRSWSFASEGPLAVNAPLGQVSAVAVDPLGNVFAADTENAIVVRISTAGTLTVVAGNG